MASNKKGITQKQIPVKKNLKSPQGGAGVNFSREKYFIPAVIFLLCLLLYGNTLWDYYTLDDEIVTFKNEFIIKGFSALKDIFAQGSLYGWNKATYVQQYRPLTLFSFMAEVSMFGLNPHISHLFNILLFAGTVVLLYFFLQRILKNYNQAIIIAATLLFAFHPIHTEDIASIKSRDEILALLFGLTSFYYIMLYQDKKKNSYYFFSLIVFFASLFCKESALTFVAIIPLLLYFFTSLDMKKIASQSLPYIGLAVIYLFIRSRVLQSMTFESQIGIMDNSLMAAKNGADRMATSFVFLGKYIYMTIIPYPLSYDYSYNQIPIVSWGNIKAILSLLVTVALIAFMIWGVRKKSIYSFLIALFFITIFISSNLVVKIASSFAERFLYVPSLSVCIALPILAAKALRLNPLQLTWKNKNKFYIPMACLLIICTVIVIPRNAQWKNNFTLFSSGVVVSLNSARAHRFLEFQYADSAANSKDSAKKLEYYSLAIRETKRAIEINMGADWLYDLGGYYKAEGHGDSAINIYKRVLQLQPNYSVVSNSLGVIYFNEAKYDSAVKYFTMSYNADPNSLEALQNIGASYLFEKNYPQVFHYDSLVLKKDPNNKPTLSNLAVLCNNIGMEYFNTNQLDKALEEFSLSLKYDSNSLYAIGNIGAIYRKMGNIEMARRYYQKGLSKAPQNEIFIKNLQSLNGSH